MKKIYKFLSIMISVFIVLLNFDLTAMQGPSKRSRSETSYPFIKNDKRERTVRQPDGDDQSPSKKGRVDDKKDMDNSKMVGVRQQETSFINNKRERTVGQPDGDDQSPLKKPRRVGAMLLFLGGNYERLLSSLFSGLAVPDK